MKKSMSPEQIADLNEWLSGKINQHITLMLGKGKRLDFNQKERRFELTDVVGDISQHQDITEGVRAFESHKSRERPIFKISGKD